MTIRRYLAVTGATMVLSFALVWAWVAAVPLAYLDPEYPYWRAKQILMRGCDLGDTILIGDSRAAAGVIPELLPLKLTNLAVGGGTPIEGLAVLSRVLACPEHPRQVILSFDIAHFTQPDLFWERTVRFGFLDRAELSTLAQVSSTLNDWSVHEARRNDGLSPAVRAALYLARFPSLHFTSLAKAGGAGRWRRNHRALADGLAARGHYTFGTAPGSSLIAAEGHMTEFRPLPVLDHYFETILSDLATQGIAAMFVVMPVNEATGRAIRPEVRDGYARYLAAKAARYPGLRITGSIPPIWPNRLFGDGFSHLNPTGAALFSAWLGSCLRRLASCEEPRLQPRLQAAPPRTQNEAQNG